MNQHEESLERLALLGLFLVFLYCPLFALFLGSWRQQIFVFLFHLHAKQNVKNKDAQLRHNLVLSLPQKTHKESSDRALKAHLKPS